MSEDREFIQGMLKAFSSIYKDANKGFSDDVYKLATDPNVSFVELKRKFDQICKDNGIPMSEGLKKFQDHLNQAVQKEEDLVLVESSDNVEPITEETVVDNEKVKEEVVTEQPVEVQPENEVVEEVLEDKQIEEPVTSEEVEEVETTIDSLDSDVDYSNDKVVLTQGPNDTIDSIGKQLLDLKAKGILAEVVINGVVLSNNNFDNINQMKKDYYAVESQKLKDSYNNAMLNKNVNEHINMAIVTPQGENNKRTVMINNINNPSANTIVQFEDGNDFDQYVMPELIDSFIGTDNNITVIDDELGISRGHNFSIDQPHKDRYVYMAQMSNGNQLALTMAESSIDKTKTYINERLEDVTKEVNKEANQAIKNAINNEHELEKANNKVKQIKLTPPSSNGFVSGLGIGALVGLSVIGNIVVLYLLKIFG